MFLPAQYGSVSWCSTALRTIAAAAGDSHPKENLWDEIREKIFKNYALKSIDAVHQKLEEAMRTEAH
jgi:hypothetical protein